MSAVNLCFLFMRSMRLSILHQAFSLIVVLQCLPSFLRNISGTFLEHNCTQRFFLSFKKVDGVTLLLCAVRTHSL